MIGMPCVDSEPRCHHWELRRFSRGSRLRSPVSPRSGFSSSHGWHEICSKRWSTVLCAEMFSLPLRMFVS